MIGVPGSRRGATAAFVVLLVFVLGADPGASPETAPRNRASVCDLSGEKPIATGRFVTVLGRLGRDDSGFILLDKKCPTASVHLRESAPGILGETCSPESPKVGLRCLLDSTTRAVSGLVSGVFEVGPDGAPYITVWDLNNVVEDDT